MDHQAEQPGDDVLGQRAIAGTLPKRHQGVTFSTSDTTESSLLFRGTTRPPFGGELPPPPIFDHFARFRQLIPRPWLRNGIRPAIIGLSGRGGTRGDRRWYSP